MGIVRMGPPKELILNIVSAYPTDTFIETGTFRGATAFWASQIFKTVITIENSESHYEEAVRALKKEKQVHCVFGDSRVELNRWLQSIDKRAVLWLDSHWCGQGSFGAQDQCPLMRELEAVNASAIAHVLLIDDARLFLSPPPMPNKKEQWPALAEIFRVLDGGMYARYTVVFDDVIIAVPEEMKETVATWCQRENTRRWRARGSELARDRTQLKENAVVRAAKKIFRRLRGQ